VASAAGLGSASADGLEMQFAYSRPSADIDDGGWTNETGSATDLYASLDEGVANDNDFIRSSANPSLDTCTIAASDPTGIAAQPLIVSYRFARTGSGGTAELRVRLMQGATEIAAWTESAIGGDFVTRDRELSPAEFASITDFNDLRFEFRADYAA
jgi:hypothetical protein